MAQLAAFRVRKFDQHTIGIDNRHNVKVELVNERLYRAVRRVLGEELPSHVLDSHGADPFSSMDGAVEKNSGLGAFAAASPDVDTCQGSSLERGSSSDDLRTSGKSTLQVSQELDVVRI